MVTARDDNAFAHLRGSAGQRVRWYLSDRCPYSPEQGRRVNLRQSCPSTNKQRHVEFAIRLNHNNLDTYNRDSSDIATTAPIEPQPLTGRTGAAQVESQQVRQNNNSASFSRACSFTARGPLSGLAGYPGKSCTPAKCKNHADTNKADQTTVKTR